LSIKSASEEGPRGKVLRRVFLFLVFVPGCLAALAGLVAVPALLEKFSPDSRLEAGTIAFVNRARLVLVFFGTLTALAGWLVFRCAGRDEAGQGGDGGRAGHFFDLFIISFLVLFFELLYIRWLPCYVRTLSYFTNFVLIGAFVGMSIGCLAASLRVRLIDFVPASVFVTVLVVAAFYVLYAFEFLRITPGEIADEQRIYFGIGALRRGLSVPLALVIPVAYVFVVFPFIGLGQTMGRALKLFGPVQAYSVNVLGSIAGILAFSLVSTFCVPAHYWFLIGFAALGWFISRNRRRLRISSAILFVCTVLIVYLLSSGLFEFETFWSPYYRLALYNKKTITVNEIGHQVMEPVGRETDIYGAPYMLRDYAGVDKPIENILIIGAGSGNDAAYAVARGVAAIDAVDIDPVIMDIGRRFHPNRPYDAPNVRAIVDDGRSLLRKTDKQYDMIVYALVDSLTLMSTYSSVRLENYLFTRECFEEVESRLAEGGVFVIYNYFRRGWLGTKIYDMLEHAFGRKPLVFSMREIESIKEDDSALALVMFIAGDTEKIEKALAGSTDRRVQLANSFAPGAKGTYKLYRVEVESSGKLPVPTDDWPFLYLKEKTIPVHNVLGILVIIVLSAAYFYGFTPGRPRRLNWHFFFLGAAFMLLETRSIAKLSLLFGSTWMVNSIVFFSILVTILLANLVVIFFPKANRKYYYVGLFAVMTLNYVIPLSVFLPLERTPKFILSNLLIFSPIFFAALVFASSFGKSTEPDYDFGSNIAGAVLGGVCEYLSLLFGYHMLLLIGAFMYLMSILGLRAGKAPAGGVARAP